MAQLEEMMQRGKRKKQGMMGEGNETNETEKQLISSHSRINKLKGEIGHMRRQLVGVFNIDNIVKIEDELKNKTRVLGELEADHQALLKVSRGQEKAYKYLSKEDDYQRSISLLSD